MPQTHVLSIQISITDSWKHLELTYVLGKYMFQFFILGTLLT